VSQLDLLRDLIRESLLLESGQFISIDEVTSAVDNAIRPARLNIDIPGFRELMIEIAVVETGIKDRGALVLRDEKSGGIQGVFQLSPIALRQLREPTAVPQTKERFNKSGASLKNWDKQTDTDIFSSLKMQAIAACMYTLWIYHNLADEPSLSTVRQRAAFWDKYYNTEKDTDGTATLYVKRVKELLGY
jgi:hypothetical protein